MANYVLQFQIKKRNFRKILSSFFLKYFPKKRRYLTDPILLYYKIACQSCSWFFRPGAVKYYVVIFLAAYLRVNALLVVSSYCLTVCLFVCLSICQSMCLFLLWLIIKLLMLLIFIYKMWWHLRDSNNNDILQQNNNKKNKKLRIKT